MSLTEKKYYPWLLVALLWVVALLNYMDRQMLSTMQEAMKADIFELQKAEAFGALMAVFLWVYGLVSPFAGMVADRLSRKTLIVASLFVWSGVTMLMGFATNFTELYVLRALMGISEALYIPSSLSLIADWHDGRSRSLAIGIHATGLYAGQAIGGFGAAVAGNLSWQTTFHSFGFLGMAYAVVLMFFLHENPIHSSSRGSKGDGATAEEIGATATKEPMLNTLTMVLSTGVFWVLLFYFAAPSLPGWATKNWLPTLFATSLNIPMTQAGPMSTFAMASSSLVGVLVGGRLSDWWVQRNLRGRVYTSTIGLSLTIPALLLLGLGHNVVAVVGAGILFGFGFGIFDCNSMPILCQIIPSRGRATAYGIMNMVGVFSGAAVTQVLGRLSDNGQLGMGFAIMTIVVAIALVLMLVFMKPNTDGKD